MKIITQSSTPKFPFYLHLGYVSASETPPEYFVAGMAAFIVMTVFFLVLKAIMKAVKAVGPMFEVELNRRGNRLFDAGKYGEALECFDKAIARNPHYADSYFNKGHTLVKMSMKNEALEAFNRYLSLAEDSGAIEAVKEIVASLSGAEPAERTGGTEPEGSQKN